MSSIGNDPGVIRTLNPTEFYEELNQIKNEASKVIQDALTNFGVVLGNSGTSQGSAPLLAPPDQSVISAADLTVRIALLQDALNQLMQEVSKLEIEGRLNELNQSNADELNKIKEQIAEAKEAMRKQAEADKKAGVFEAIGNWFKAAFDFVSAAFSAIAAIGYALTGNVVAAAGLFVAAGALIASGVCNFVLAVDATIRATGGTGMSEELRGRFEKAAEICGYIALVAGAISGVAAITSAVRSAVGTAAKEMANYGIKASTKEMVKMFAQSGKEAIRDVFKEAFTKVTKNAFNTAVKEVTKEAAEQAAQQAILIAIRSGGSAAAETAAREAVDEVIRIAVKEAMAASLKPLTQMIDRIVALTTVYTATTQGTQAGFEIAIGEIEKDVAAHQLKADQAEAEAKAFEALITMLRNMIEQLQQALEEMVESCMESVQAVFNAADESMSSMKTLFQAQTN